MRNKIRKKILSLLLAGILAAGLCGCGQEAETQKTRVAMIVKSTESAFWKSVFAGAGAAATEYNINVSFDGPAAEEDYETQNEMVRRAMDDGVDVIIFSAVDYNANAEIIDQAAQRGIKIIVIDSDVNSSQVSCRIGTNNLQAGIKAAEAALATDDEELYIGIVNYDVNSANGQQRELGFRQTVEQDPRVKNITTINVLSTTEDARAGAKEMLLSDSRINVVVTFNEWTSLGVGWAIRDLNRADRIQVVAFDSNVVSVGMLETGEVDALIVQNPYAMGYLGVETAANLMNGQTGGPSVVDTATTIVTRENMYEYNAAMDAGIPVIYTAVTDPVAAELASEDGTPAGEVTGTSDKLPVEEQLKMIREMLPQAKTIGIMYTTSEANSVSAIKEYEDLVGKYDFELVTKGITTTADVSLAADDLLSKVDCITNLTDNTVVASLPTILEKANDKKIPVFGSEIEQVKIG